ncbi:MAG: hypothetical protein ACXAC8_05400 [Candidatus Hodarchaeales archaeon]
MKSRRGKRFPPRKARNTSTLINFVVRWLDKFQILLNPIPSSSPFNDILT